MVWAGRSNDEQLHGSADRLADMNYFYGAVLQQTVAQIRFEYLKLDRDAGVYEGYVECWRL